MKADSEYIERFNSAPEFSTLRVLSTGVHEGDKDRRCVYKCGTRDSRRCGSFFFTTDIDRNAIDALFTRNRAGICKGSASFALPLENRRMYTKSKTRCIEAWSPRVKALTETLSV